MLLILILLALAITFGIATQVGAPYLPILSRDTQTLLDLSGLKAGQTLIDLGSGDGRLLRAAAARGIRGIGYEINPLLVAVSWLVCWRYRRLVTIRLGNFWHTELPPADAIYVFLLPKYMTRLDHWLKTQVHRPTRLVSYAFDIPGRKTTVRNANTFVYEYVPKARHESPVT